MKAGEFFTEENVCSIRPGYGLPPKYLKKILGRRATQNIKKGSAKLGFDKVTKMKVYQQYTNYIGYIGFAKREEYVRHKGFDIACS